MAITDNHPFKADAGQIQHLIDKCGGDSDAFVAQLHHSGITHISFSQVYAFETCPRQYYLRYILGRTIEPVPEYFIKGKALHRTIANAYKALGEGRAINEEVIHYDGINRHSRSGNHLRNGYLTFCQNIMPADEIFGIEKPFVFLLNGAIPPVVGVIDLILRRGETMVMIDHKTGRDFYQPDVLQMAVYNSYLRSTGIETTCEFYYDSYRWVENLARIRKPAFERKQMIISENEIEMQLSRLVAGYDGIQMLKHGGMPERNGECFKCAYRNLC